MFGDIEFALRKNLQDRDYAEEYASSFLNAYVATQIKVIREQRGMTQAELGTLIGTTQAGVSRYEDVNYSSWSLRTLMKLARAFDVRLRVTFEPYGTLPDEVIRFDRDRLATVARENDALIGGRQVLVEPQNVADIGAYKALAQIGQRAERDTGGHPYGSDRNSKSTSDHDAGVGRAVESWENSAVGLHSAVG
jgi:transcriptional regulator with XRE-family HTH domain